MIRILAAFPILAGLTATAGEVDYLRDIKPVLAARCYSCHGAMEQKASLRVDTAASLRAGGDSGPLIEPGSVAESYLIDVLTGDAGLRMPPEGEPLDDAQIDLIRAWIAAGAPAPADEAPQPSPKDHWAFRPPVRPAVPAVADPAWGANPIDAFLAAEHERRGLVPVAEADRATLLRRVALDLTGLVPTREELQTFLIDDRPDAYELAVDRLLASPAFGERWGRHWMDVWRYSDWDGYGNEVRESRPHIWRWRDWIVESLNADVGYDRMVRAMLAGDEIAPDDPSTLRATGFLARNWYKFNRNIWLDNTVEHTSKAFLGLTVACARCHDHKYDPIPQADYYRFRAFFEPIEVAADRVPGQPDTDVDGIARVYDAHDDQPTYLYRRGDEKQPVEDHPLDPAVPRALGAVPEIAPVDLPAVASYQGLRDHVRREALDAAEAAVAAAGADLESARAESRPEDAIRLAELGLRTAVEELEAVEARLDADDARYAEDPDDARVALRTLRAGLAERRAAASRTDRDRARAARSLAEARAAVKDDDSKTKKAVEAAEKALADATKAAEEAAKTLDGSLPTSYTPFTPVRPETSTGRRLALARWITDRSNPLTARVAVNQVWMRHFGAPLVGSVFDFGINGEAPSHPELLDWLAVELMESGWSLKHLHRLIVTSRAYRMRSTAGADHPNAAIDPENRALWRMNPQRMESELVRDNVFRVAGTLDPSLGGPDLDPDSALTTPRRSLYFRHAKEKRATFLKLFDSPNVVACYRRDVSVAPQQALALANSTLTLGQARILAGQLAAEVASEDSEAFVELAFERVLGRGPLAEERDACLGYLREQAERLAEPGDLTPYDRGPDSPVAPSPDPSERAREDLIHVLMNHTDFLTIR